jgi:hypothetical protein
MGWEPSSSFLQQVGYWQTLIAGGLALVAGGATVWATRNAAKQEIDANRAQMAQTRTIEQQRATD